MDQIRAQEFLRKMSVVIGPDDDRSEIEVAEALIARRAISDETKSIMGGVAVVNLPTLERGRPYFAG